MLLRRFTRFLHLSRITLIQGAILTNLFKLLHKFAAGSIGLLATLSPGRILLLFALQCGCANAQEAFSEKSVTFYSTYGFPVQGGWTIPLKLWVYEEPDIVRNLAARAALGELQDRAELPELTVEQQGRYRFRTHDFVADSESRESVQIRFDNDPAATIFTIHDAEGESKTDRNGLLDGLLALSSSQAEYCFFLPSNVAVPMPRRHSVKRV
jgi:hypothetical protein